MKKQLFIFILSTLAILPSYFSQPLVFKENAKWGIRENQTLLVKPVYDSVFNFNVDGNVCLVCYKTMGASSNKFIKTLTKIYLCNYLNREGKRLSVRADGNDTNSVFVLAKHTAKQFSENPDYFITSVKTKKHLIDKNFKQITFKGYHDLLFTPVPGFVVAHITGEGNSVSAGLINLKEEIIIPFQYSDFKINTRDSLIIGCSAGVREGAEDDIFNYDGKKIAGYRKHVYMATKSFVIHKIYEPKEYFIINNLATKEEKILNADEIKLHENDELLLRIKNDWFLYNMTTNEKKPNKQS